MRYPITRESVSEELGNNLQIGLATGLIGGGLLGFLAAAATVAQNPALLTSAGDVVRLLLGLQIVYAVLCLAIGLAGAAVKTLLFLLAGLRFSDTKTAAFAAWTVFFLLGSLYAISWARWHQIGGLAPDAPVAPRHLPVLLILLAINAILARLLSHAFYLLIVHVKKPERRRPGDLRRAFLILVYMAGAFALFLAAMRFTSAPVPSRSGLTQDLINPNGRDVRVIGIEGMERDDFLRLRREGLLAWADPLLAGAVGDLTLPPDPVPPVTWTVIATGRDLSAHGIWDYQTRAVKGLPASFSIGPNQIGLFELVHSVLPFFRMTRAVPVKSYMRESKGLWNMAADAGLRSVVVNWWVSWPAERVRGSVVSDHAWLKLTGEIEDTTGAPNLPRYSAGVQTPGHGMQGASSPLRPDGEPLFLERETWPSTLLIELSVLAGSALPETLAARFGPLPSTEALDTFEKWRIPADVLRSDLFYAQSAAWLLERGHPELWMLHLPGPDILRRVLLKHALPPPEREQARREVLRAYWTTLEPALRAATMPPGAKPATTLLLALPGLSWPETPARNAGLLAAAGPDARPGTWSPPVRLAEITPTVLWLLGLPASREMDGTPRTDAWTGSAVAALTPVRWIPSYGRQETTGLEQAAGTLDQEMMERFRSLGYIR